MAEQYSSYARELRAGRPVMAQTVGDRMQPLLYQGRMQAVLHGLCYSIHGECVVLSVCGLCSNLTITRDDPFVFLFIRLCNKSIVILQRGAHQLLPPIDKASCLFYFLQ